MGGFFFISAPGAALLGLKPSASSAGAAGETSAKGSAGLGGPSRGCAGPRRPRARRCASRRPTPRRQLSGRVTFAASAWFAAAKAKEEVGGSFSAGAARRVLPPDARVPRGAERSGVGGHRGRTAGPFARRAAFPADGRSASGGSGQGEHSPGTGGGAGWAPPPVKPRSLTFQSQASTFLRSVGDCFSLHQNPRLHDRTRK